MTPELQMAIIVGALTLAVAGLGFFAGYRGTWQHRFLAIAAFPCFHILTQTIYLISPFSRPTKDLGLDLVIAWIIAVGSIAGSILRDRVAYKRTLASHAGFVVGTSCVSLVFRWLVRI